MPKLPSTKLMSVVERERLEAEKQRRKRSKKAMRDREVEDARNGILKDAPTKPMANPTEEKGHRSSYFLTDDTETTANPMVQIHSYLEAQGDGYGLVSIDKFKEDIGIDLGDPRNCGLLQGLSRNELIDIDESTLRRKHPMGIESELQLYRLFQNDIPNDIVKTEGGLSMLGVSEKQLVGCFDGVGMCIDEMIKDGMVQEICTRDVRSSRPERVFFPAPTGMPVPEGLRDLWNSIPVPGEAELKKQLLERKLRTPREYEIRKERKKEINESEVAGRAAEKQRVKDEKKEIREKIKFDALCNKNGWTLMKS